MFARSCPRMGVRFASGNVFYMNKTFSARHLQSVASPLSTGFITPARFSSTTALFAGAPSALTGFGGDSLVETSRLDEPIGLSRQARQDIAKALVGLDMVPTSVLKDCFVCAPRDDQTARGAMPLFAGSRGLLSRATTFRFVGLGQ